MSRAVVPPSSAPETPSGSAESSQLGSSVCIKGTVVSHGDFYFDGEMKGSIEAPKSTVTMGPNAKVEASIRARKVVIMGTVQGQMEALESIELRRTCRLVGNLLTDRVAMEDGAYFNGSVEMCRQTGSSSDAAGPEEKYSRLVDLKNLRGLSKTEEAELERLASQQKAEAPLFMG